MWFFEGTVVGWLDWMGEPIPPAAQWIAWLAGMVGTAVAVATAVVAVRAARQATMASEAATEAAAAATRLGRVAQLGDIAAELKELQLMIVSPFDAIRLLPARADSLRARIVRFKGEARSELTDEEKQHLDLAREHLISMSKAAVNPSFATDEARANQLQRAFGYALESLNHVLALHATPIEDT